MVFPGNMPRLATSEDTDVEGPPMIPDRFSLGEFGDLFSTSGPSIPENIAVIWPTSDDLSAYRVLVDPQNFPVPAVPQDPVIEHNAIDEAEAPLRLLLDLGRIVGLPQQIEREQAIISEGSTALSVVTQDLVNLDGGPDLEKHVPRKEAHVLEYDAIDDDEAPLPLLLELGRIFGLPQQIEREEAGMVVRVPALGLVNMDPGTGPAFGSVLDVHLHPGPN